MAPVTRSKKKQDLGTPPNKFQSDSSRGVKRSAEEEEKEKTEEKRGRQDMTETGMILEKAEEENQQKEEETGKELIEPQEESSDNSHSETSFMDLPDDVHTNIFAFLDLPSRLKLRVNKRLDRLHFSVKINLRIINLKIGWYRCRLSIDIVSEMSRSNLSTSSLSPVPSSIFSQWEQGLRRFAQNSFVDVTDITVDHVANEQQCLSIDALFNFNARITLLSRSHVGPRNLAHLSLPSFLTLAQNVRFARIEIICSALTAYDLCTIRKTMIEGGCKMESFYMFVDREMQNSFMEECFRVIIEDVSESRRGKIYHSPDEYLELYQYLDSKLDHYEGNFHTSVSTMDISFKKLEVVEKPHDKHKIRLNEISYSY